MNQCGDKVTEHRSDGLPILKIIGWDLWGSTYLTLTLTLALYSLDHMDTLGIMGLLRTSKII